MTKQTEEALRLIKVHDESGNIEDLVAAYNACKEALEHPTKYLYVYKGSDIWLKDSLDIPSAGFLIGKIRLEK